MSVCVYIYEYIYIYIEREREGVKVLCNALSVFVCIRMADWRLCNALSLLVFIRMANWRQVGVDWKDRAVKRTLFSVEFFGGWWCWQE